MKQTTYTCDWCKHEITGDRIDIKIGKGQYHMCGPCHWDMLQPVMEKIPEIWEAKHKSRGDDE